MELEAVPPLLSKPEVDLRPSQQIKDPAELWEDPPEPGKGVPMSTRIDPTIKAFIQEAIQSGVFRFRSENDFLRTALVWFCRDQVIPFYRAGLFDTTLKRKRAMARLSAVARELADSEHYYLQFKAAVITAQAQGQSGLGERVMREMLLLLQEDHYSEWSAEVRRRIDKEPLLAALRAKVEAEGVAAGEEGH